MPGRSGTARADELGHLPPQERPGIFSDASIAVDARHRSLDPDGRDDPEGAESAGSTPARRTVEKNNETKMIGGKLHHKRWCAGCKSYVWTQSTRPGYRCDTCLKVRYRGYGRGTSGISSDARYNG